MTRLEGNGATLTIDGAHFVATSPAERHARAVTFAGSIEAHPAAWREARWPDVDAERAAALAFEAAWELDRIAWAHERAREPERLGELMLAALRATAGVQVRAIATPSPTPGIYQPPEDDRRRAAESREAST